MLQPFLPPALPLIQRLFAAPFNPLSIASSALPAHIKESLKGEEVTEGRTATLRCELTKVAQVEWRKGSTLLQASDKYKMRQEGTVMKLLIHDTELKDAGEYTCVCGEQETTAALIVNGKKNIPMYLYQYVLFLLAHHYLLCVHLQLDLDKSVSCLQALVAPRLLFCFYLFFLCPRITRELQLFLH